VGEARKSGKGLKLNEWRLDACDEAGLGEAVESILTWCRDILAGCRRPYGIDRFDLTLAVRASNARVHSLTLDKLRPIDLYQDSLPERLIGLLSSEVERMKAASLHLTAGLFSWGEAAHEALPQRT
jgi:hypothetical protein